MSDERPHIESSRPTPGPAVRVSRRRRMTDLFDVREETKDPAKHYHFARRDDIDITNLKLDGYVFERANDPNGAKPIGDYDDPGDGTITVGDTVLMSCSKADYEAREQEEFLRREEILNSTTAETENEAKKRGVKIIKDKE